MAKSKTRGGAKAHRKRVQSRNSHIKGVQTQMQRMFQEEMTKKMEELKENTEDTVETVQKTGLEIPKIVLPNDDENTPIEIKL
tara:strand:+ start:2577 stop:2825 length:249 start_codon:yes stop_codon:yes gene_type:complete